MQTLPGLKGRLVTVIKQGCVHPSGLGDPSQAFCRHLERSANVAQQLNIHSRTLMYRTLWPRVHQHSDLAGFKPPPQLGDERCQACHLSLCCHWSSVTLMTREEVNGLRAPKCCCCNEKVHTERSISGSRSVMFFSGRDIIFGTSGHPTNA